MKLPYKIMSTAAMAVVLGSVQMISANAAVGDFYNQTTSTKYLKADLVSNNALVSKLEAEMDAKNVVIKEVSNGKYLDYDKANTAFVAAIADHVDPSIAIVKAATAGKTEATKEILDAYKPATTKLTVTSVSAINQTIAANKATDLKFSVNGLEKLTKTEFEKKYEGYKVDFKYNKMGLDLNGKVTVSDAFKYAVQVTDKDGNMLPKTLAPADFVEVTVVDATKATKVNEIGLVNATGKEWTAPSITKEDTVRIAATLYENGFAESNKDKDSTVTQPKVKTVKSSDSLTAYYADGIKVLKAGTVTLTVEFEGITETKTIQVTTKDAQEVTSIKADAQKVQAGVANQTAKFTLLDKAKEEMRTTVGVFYTVTADGATTESTILNNLNVVKAAGEINSTFVKGINTINVYDDAKKTNKLGTFTVEAVEVANVAPDTYKLVVAADTAELDMNTAADKNNIALDIKVEAYVNGVNVDFPSNGVKYEVLSSNEKVATVVRDGSKIKVAAVAKGSTTITLYTVEGDLKTPVATYNVTVNNTTPQITSLTLKEGPAGKIKVNKLTDLKAAVIAAVVDGDKLPADAIKTVTAVDNDAIVIVEIASIYGGKTFTLAAEVDTVAPTVSGIKVNGNAVEVGTENTITLKSAEITKAESTLNENVKVTVILKDGTKLAKDKAVTTTDLFKTFSTDSTVTLATVNMLDGATVTLVDAAENATTYTITIAK